MSQGCLDAMVAEDRAAGKDMAASQRVVEDVASESPPPAAPDFLTSCGVSPYFF